MLLQVVAQNQDTESLSKEELKLSKLEEKVQRVQEKIDQTKIKMAYADSLIQAGIEMNNEANSEKKPNSHCSTSANPHVPMFNGEALTNTN